jgi:hypothetical protein
MALSMKPSNNPLKKYKDQNSPRNQYNKHAVSKMFFLPEKKQSLKTRRNLIGLHLRK